MPKPIREFFQSSRAAAAASVLVIAAVLFHNRQLAMVACALWLASLICGLEHARTRRGRVIWGLLCALAAVLLAVLTRIAVLAL